MNAADVEWLMADYRSYERHAEEAGDSALSFDEWLATETVEYRRAHGVRS